MEGEAPKSDKLTDSSAGENKAAVSPQCGIVKDKWVGPSHHL